MSTRFVLLGFAGLLLAGFSVSCQGEKYEPADYIFANGDFYTVDTVMPYVGAIAVADGRIVARGSTRELRDWKGDGTRVVDLGGQFVMPGFIEGHAHFSNLGYSLLNLNLLGTGSYREVLDSVAARVAKAAPGEWIYGRGWHQEKWNDTTGFQTVDGYPLNDSLSALSPDNPVLLTHASGHGAMANRRAMELAGVTPEVVDPAGGRIVRDAEGDPIGIFEERAADLLYDRYQAYHDSLPQLERRRERNAAWLLAEEASLREGITTFQDAGTSRVDLEGLRYLAQTDSLRIRLWMMVRESCAELTGGLGDYPWIGLGNDHLTVRAIKSELDGALGSYGAWLLAPYDDKPGFTGQNTTSLKDVDCLAAIAYRKGMQLCVHAIGDRANRETLDLFAEYAERSPDKTLRWRIEHAQHLSPEDIPRFTTAGAIASMQAIHATSDAPFVVARLGEERARTGAYAWRSLKDAGAVVTNGTDAPVEPVSALASLYAMITRKRPGGTEAFFPEQALTRAEAIAAYTLQNAYAGFEEKDKGSLEVGKLADFIVLDTDLISCPVDSIPTVRVLETYVGGEQVWARGT